MTDVGTLTLSEFLLARIAEDENRVRAFMDSEDFPSGVVVRKHWRIQLAECDAKRQIVEMATETERSATVLDELHGLDDWSPVSVQRDVLRLLALPYADHPDYRSEWRP